MAKRENDRAHIIRAAIELVAENGIAAVTTRQIAKKAGVSDGLMYRFFNSKEDLLASCLYQIADNIADHFQAEVTRKISGQEEFKRVAHERWNMYFSYLLENVSETLFFYEFSESANMRKLLEEKKFSISNYYYMLNSRLGAADQAFIHAKDEDIPFFWVFYFHISATFAVKIIRGEFSDSNETREKVWTLLSQGISCYLPNN